VNQRQDYLHNSGDVDMMIETGDQKEDNNENKIRDKVYCLHLISLIMLNVAKNSDSLPVGKLTKSKDVHAQRRNSTKKLIKLVFEIIKILNIEQIA
jgi:hypothetical protein